MKKAKNTWQFYWWYNLKSRLYKTIWQFEFNSETREMRIITPFFGLFYDDPTLPF